MARIPIEIPRIGLVMETARILRWLKSVGDTVQPGDPLVEVETEKATIEIEATVGGQLAEVTAELDEQVAVGARIAWVEDGQPEAQGPEEQVPAHAATGIPATFGMPAITAPPSVRLRTSPTARRLAAEHGIDLTEVAGSGPGGRIQLADVQKAVNARKATPGILQAAPTVSAVPFTPVIPASVAGGQPRPLSAMRRAVARAMTLSNATIPQFTVSRTVDWTEMESIRRVLAPSLKQTGIGLSSNDFLLQAVARGLAEFPALNGILSGDPSSPDAHILQASGAHIGLVVATEDGMVVPVLHGVERLSLAELARERAAIVDRARNRRLHQEESTGATFTISNLGATGPDRFTAILNPPESCILAVGRMREVPVVRDGAIAIRPVSELALTVDHRLADGKLASDFLAGLVQILEGKEWRLV